MWILAGEAVFSATAVVVVAVDGGASRIIRSGEDILVSFGSCYLVCRFHT